MPKMGKADFSSLLKFQKQIADLSQKQADYMFQTALRRIAGQLLRMVKERTPTDTGHLRRGWTASKIRKVGSQYIVDIINPVNYALYVEKGYRIMGGEGNREQVGWQEGHFMLKISADELEGVAPKILKDELNKFLNKLK